jgi:hypothetical protein
MPAMQSFLHVACALQRMRAFRQCLAAERILAWHKENCSACRCDARTREIAVQLNRDNDAAATRCRRNGPPARRGTSP